MEKIELIDIVADAECFLADAKKYRLAVLKSSNGIPFASDKYKPMTEKNRRVSILVTEIEKVFAWIKTMELVYGD